MLSVSELYIYPVKSLGGIRLERSRITDRGLEHDRRWMLVDGDNQFVTQRKLHRMALLRTGMDDVSLHVHVLGDPSDNIAVPLRNSSSDQIQVEVWGDVCEALHVSSVADQWFSRQLQQQVRLVYMPVSSRRPVDPRYALHNDITSFSDGYPILMIGQLSLDDLNSRLSEPVPMNRFRPNIVFTGGTPYEEDTMKAFTINDISFFGVKPCARCVLTTVDQDSGVSGKEPLRTLASYRTVDSKVLFGQNVLSRGFGEIRVGDQLQVIQ